jgi:hypothetical protein
VQIASRKRSIDSARAGKGEALPDAKMPASYIIVHMHFLLRRFMRHVQDASAMEARIASTAKFPQRAEI